MGKIVQFPREVIVEGLIRTQERHIESMLEAIETYDPETSGLSAAILADAAPGSIDRAREKIRNLRAEQAMMRTSQVLRYNGVEYRAVRGSAGPN